MGHVHGSVAWDATADENVSYVSAMMHSLSHQPWSWVHTQMIAFNGATGYLASHQHLKPRDGTGSQPPPDDDVVAIADLLLLESPASSEPLTGQERVNASLIDAYRRFGIAICDHVTAEGTFALYDATVQRLLLYRDPAGTRALYYFYEPRRLFVFSSDMRSLLSHPRVRAELDLVSVRTMLEYDESCPPPSRTLCRGIWRLPAGHALTLERSRLTVWRYWRPELLPERRYKHDNEYVEELRGLVGDAVQGRLAASSDSHAAHLSGGLDSSSVAILAAEAAAGKPVVGYSWAPDFNVMSPLSKDERVLAQACARRATNLELVFAAPRVSEWLDVVTRDLAVEPTTTLHIEASVIRDAASRGITSVLSGWGSDETVAFNGRGYFADLTRRGRLLTVQREFRRRSQVHGGSVAGQWRHRVVQPLVPHSFRPRLGLPIATTKERPLPDELRPEFVAALRPVEPVPERLPGEMAGVRATQYRLLTRGHLQYRMESWASYAADFAIVHRYPLLDRRIMEFSLTIPAHLYFRDGWKRWLYRTAMDGILPDEVRWYPDKRDSAAAAGHALLRSAARPLFLERLRQRSGNPYVDTDLLLKRIEGEATDKRGGYGYWLAFTETGRA